MVHYPSTAACAAVTHDGMLYYNVHYLSPKTISMPFAEQKEINILEFFVDKI